MIYNERLEKKNPYKEGLKGFKMAKWRFGKRTDFVYFTFKNDNKACKVIQRHCNDFTCVYTRNGIVDD